ncbi:MAG: phage tail protein [Phototrophicales bacterium]|nr:phage tail protein [Phototrophicales bacterium]
MPTNFVAVDSLVANEFEIQIDNNPMLGVFRVDGLTTFKLNDKGERVYEPFRIIKMVQRDANNSFNTWLRETTAPNSQRPRRTVSILAVDDDVETRRWTVKGAWIQELTYSAFDTASHDMVEEIITIHYDSIEESFPATPDLGIQ